MRGALTILLFLSALCGAEERITSIPVPNIQAQAQPLAPSVTYVYANTPMDNCLTPVPEARLTAGVAVPTGVIVPGGVGARALFSGTWFICGSDGVWYPSTQKATETLCGLRIAGQNGNCHLFGHQTQSGFTSCPQGTKFHSVTINGVLVGACRSFGSGVLGNEWRQ